MNPFGIIAEFNPFHNGHYYLINTAKRLGATHIAAVMSGNFVQRGDAAVVGKFARAEMAVRNGVDLVLELPVPYSLSTAMRFADGGVGILKDICGTLIFGSECGNINTIKAVADGLANKDFKIKLHQLLGTGMTFAAARETALLKTLGNSAHILGNPNDTLAVEYLAAAARQNAGLDFIAVKRYCAAHNDAENYKRTIKIAGLCELQGGSDLRSDSSESMDSAGKPDYINTLGQTAMQTLHQNKDRLSADGVSSKICSAAAIRRDTKSGPELNPGAAKEYMPEGAYKILEREMLLGYTTDIDSLSTAVLAQLRRMRKEDFENLPDISEGIENRIIQSAATAVDLDGLCLGAKTKRYTLARIRRIVFSAFLGIDKQLLTLPVPYIRVLAFNKKGEELMKEAKRKNLPLITSLKRAEEMGPMAKKLADCEALAGSLYAACLVNKRPAWDDYKYKIIKVD